MTDTYARMRQLIGTTSDWAADDIVIGDGELAAERTGDDSIKMKIGDGVRLYSELPYLNAGGGFENKGEIADLTPADGDTAWIIGDGDWVFDDGNWSAAVAADPYQGVIIAPASDPTGAFGAWIRVLETEILVEWFGPFDDPATNHLRIQAAMDVSQYIVGTVVLPDYTIQTKFPLFCSDNLRMEGAGPASALDNILTVAEDPGNGFRIVFMLGEGHPAYVASNTYGGKTMWLPMIDCMGSRAGSYSFYTVNPADAALFPTGHKIQQRTRAYYKGGGVAEIPHYSQSNIVVSQDPDTGRVTCQFPFLAAIPFSTTKVSNAVNSGGLVRITAYDHGTVTGASRTISGVVGATGVNGTWDITVIDKNTFDLVGSTFGGVFDPINSSGSVVKARAITDVTDNGSGTGTIRVTLIKHGFDPLLPVKISGVTGATAANGTWAITVVNANAFDLKGSTFNAPYVSGGEAVSGGAYMCNWTTGAIPSFLVPGRFVGPVYNVQLANFTLISNEITGHGFGRTAPLACDVDITTAAPEALWFNNACFCRFRARGTVQDKVIELAYNCTGSTYEFFGKYTAKPTSTQMALKLGECSSFCHISLTLDAADFNPGSNVGVIEIDNGAHNTVVINGLECAQHTGSILKFDCSPRGAIIPISAISAGLFVTGVGNKFRITTPTAHGFSTNQRITIIGVTGTGGVTAANGMWQIAKINDTSFDLNGTVFAGVYSGAGGTAAIDPGETQEPQRHNRVVNNCDIIATSAARFILVNDLGGVAENCGVVGGGFLGVPTTAAITMVGGKECYVHDTYFEAGAVNISTAVMASLNLRGNIQFSNNAYLGARSVVVNGQQMVSTGTVTVHPGSNFSIDLNKQNQTISLTGTLANTIQFIGPTGQIGSTSQIILTNNTVAAVPVTPTSGTGYDMGSFPWPTLAPGASIVFQVTRIPSASGTLARVVFKGAMHNAIKTAPLTVATLPAAATAGSGSRALVSDANAPVFAAVVVGGGAVVVPVFCDGVAWRVG